MHWRPWLERFGRDRLRPPSRSFKVAEGEPMPLVGDVLVLGRYGQFAGTPSLTLDPNAPALRIEGVADRTVWYIRLPSDDVPPGATPWVLDRRKGAARARF